MSSNLVAGTKVGVFGFGSAIIDDSDLAVVLNEVAPLPSTSSVTINAAVKNCFRQQYG